MKNTAKILRFIAEMFDVQDVDAERIDLTVKTTALGGIEFEVHTHQNADGSDTPYRILDGGFD